MEREPGEPTPCDLCPKSRDPENGVGRKLPNPDADIDNRSLHALDYYRRCEVDPLGVVVVRDAIVVRNGGVIRAVEAATARSQGAAPQQLALAMLNMAMRGGKG